MDMSTIEFFEYLARHNATRDLAHHLADAWVAQEIGYVPELQPAA
jgi:hypothetical protein